MAERFSISYSNVGYVLRAQGRPGEALKAYRDSLTISERLAKQGPENDDWQREFSMSYSKVGKVLRAQGQLGEALKVLRDSLSLFQRLAKKDPENAGWQRDVSIATP